jgi:hypothetical protein
LTREPVSGIGDCVRLAVDLAGESAYARASFDTFEGSSAGIALARADRAFLPFMTLLRQGSARQRTQE